jgi:hypothetical protein
MESADGAWGQLINCLELTRSDAQAMLSDGRAMLLTAGTSVEGRDDAPLVFTGPLSPASLLVGRFIFHRQSSRNELLSPLVRAPKVWSEVVATIRVARLGVQ